MGSSNDNFHCKFTVKCASERIYRSVCDVSTTKRDGIWPSQRSIKNVRREEALKVD